MKPPTPYSLLPTPLLPDFWSRQANHPIETFEFAPFGIPATLSVNQPELLAAAHLSAGRFSLAGQGSTAVGQTPISLQLVVTNQTQATPPDNLPEQLRYNGVGPWLTVSAGEWGHAFANLSMRTAIAFLGPGLAKDIRIVSRYFIDHYLLNFVLTEWAMLHASCVVSPDRKRLILMVAPHNTGKSTTALHLLRAGYIFLADGMALLRQEGSNFRVGGYPIGEVKLRDDVLALFPNYLGEAVKVREQRKTVVNLRLAHPEQLAETLFMPKQIQLCYVERSPECQTAVTPLTMPEAAALLAANTVYWDEPQRLQHNTTALQSLLERANLYRLRIGSNSANIIDRLNQLI